MVQGEEEGDVGGGKWRVSWVENYKRGKFNEGREREREKFPPISFPTRGVER